VNPIVASDQGVLNWLGGSIRNATSGGRIPYQNAGSSPTPVWMEGPEGGYFVTPGVDYMQYGPGDQSFMDFMNYLTGEFNEPGFTISLGVREFGTFVVGTSALTGDPTSFGAVNIFNYFDFDVATVYGYASNSGTPWMTIAEQELSNGVAEIPGPIHNNRIVEYFTATSYRATTDDPPNHWCSAFVNWTMKQANIAGTNSAAAKSWLNWGNSLDNYQFGAVTVLERNGSFHVGFAVDLTDSYVKILGGNQGNPGSVKYSNFFLRSYTGY